MSRNVIPQTPPFTVYKGQKIVKRDIERAVQGISRTKFQDKAVRKMVLKKDYQGLHEFAQRASGGKWDIVQFSPELHEGVRNSRGQVKAGKGLMTPDMDELKAYIKEKQQNVGKARGGWAAAIVRLGGTVQPWIMRHVGEGEFLDGLDSGEGFLRQRNKSPWADGKSDSRTIDRAVASRARAILKDIQLREERAARAAKLT